MQNNVPTVTDLISSIKRNLEGAYRTINVQGEVTNLSHSSSGHWYLSLSDKDSMISGALFKMDAMRNPIIKNLKDGDKVICSGSISVYPKRGTFQIIIKRIVPIGKGDLKEEFEKLKKRLAAEGLFDLEHKKQIPQLPKRIGVVTALRGAALQDFLNIIKRRSLFHDIVVSPALVQGDGAPASIRKALEKLIRVHIEAEGKQVKERMFDAIVLTRGGGSLEDLWAFNDEALAWDIYNCPIPVISAVGHQVDFSISDFVADLRCETPSAAAEILTNNQSQLTKRLDYSKKHLKASIDQIVNSYKYKLSHKSPSVFMKKIYAGLNEYKDRLATLNLVQRRVELLPLGQYQYELDHLTARMKNAVHSSYKDRKSRMEEAFNLLKVLGPNEVLARGYTYTEIDGKVISSFKDFEKISSGEEVKLHFGDGVGRARKS